jgi:hypothetical protein
MRTPRSHLTAALLATALAGGSWRNSRRRRRACEDLSQPSAEVMPHPEYVKAIARLHLGLADCEQLPPRCGRRTATKAQQSIVRWR